MSTRKSYKFRLKTNPEIESSLWQYAGHCRFVWNYFWNLNRKRLERGERIISYYEEMDFWSKILKQSDEYSFLKEVPAHLIQQKLKDLAKAYKDGFDKKQPNKRLPTVRKRQLHSSFRFPAPKQFEINNKRIKFPKIGWIGFHKSQEIDGEIKNITITQHSGHWYASINVLIEQDTIYPANDLAIGIDVGIAKFATCVSDRGEVVYEPINSYRSLEKNLAKQQRKLKNKKKFSNNWIKQNRKIQKIHSKIANIRNDYLHKISTEISKNHAMIFIENLKVANMSKSSKGTDEKHGKNVKAKSGLNKSILDQGWHKFRTQLQYKSDWNGGQLIAVDPKYTSQKCACCGHKHKDNRQSQSKFECTSCGYQANADINAARNILAAGHVVLACGAGSLDATLKQEPLGIREVIPA